jgi:hypothetical protein
MKRIFIFYKEPSNRWFVDLPEWEGSKDELEMVMGADTMLDIISEGYNKVSLVLSLEPFEECDILEKVEDTPGIGGALYIMKSYKGSEYNLKLWLCEVTRFVFGNLPENIYIN